jgi:hypothetical protein
MTTAKDLIGVWHGAVMFAPGTWHRDVLHFNKDGTGWFDHHVVVNEVGEVAAGGIVMLRPGDVAGQQVLLQRQGRVQLHLQPSDDALQHANQPRLHVPDLLADQLLVRLLAHVNLLSR